MLKSRSRVLPFVVLGLVLAAVLALVLAAGCGQTISGTSKTTVVANGESGSADTSTTAAAPDATAGETVIEVTGTKGAKSYTLDEIKAMPATEGYGGQKSSTGRITPPSLLKGVLVEDLFAEVGGFPEDMAVGIIAKDGYEMTVSYTQLSTGDFLTYDMVTGAENEVEGPLRLLVAYENDGQPLDADGWGVLRLAIVGPEKDQVTDGHWWVKWVTGVKLKPVEEEWSMTLSGTLTEQIDRPTFETCAAAGCHGQEWTDAAGDKWTGVPLYLLNGRVDDDVAHTGPAYDRDLANAGYEVEILAADGAQAIIESKTAYYNKELLVAYQLNGAALPENYWPLRLVGEGIEKSQMLGQITEIKVLLPNK